MMPSLALTAADASLASTSKLLAELEDLKRQQPAHYARSIASTLFVESWRRLRTGEAADTIAADITVKALVSILLPGCDARFFREAELDTDAATDIYRQSLQTSAQHRVDATLYDHLVSRVPTIVNSYFEPVREAPSEDVWFVEALCQQPRAGATKPEKPRLLLVPPEMHSDHCLMTAVFAVLLSPYYDASLAQPFLTGLSHHLHNAVLPDCGFGGEVLLAPWLTKIMDTAKAKALGSLDETLAQQIRKSIAVHEDLDLPEGRAASAADVLDRVLDVQWRTRVAQVRNEDILSELELVHAGPIQQFQTDLLQRAEVWG